jgi:hypothetical protein
LNGKKRQSRQAKQISVSKHSFFPLSEACKVRAKLVSPSAPLSAQGEYVRTDHMEEHFQRSV